MRHNFRPPRTYDIPAKSLLRIVLPINVNLPECAILPRSNGDEVQDGEVEIKVSGPRPRILDQRFEGQRLAHVVSAEDRHHLPVQTRRQAKFLRYLEVLDSFEAESQRLKAVRLIGISVDTNGGSTHPVPVGRTRGPHPVDLIIIETLPSKHGEIGNNDTLARIQHSLPSRRTTADEHHGATAIMQQHDRWRGVAVVHPIRIIAVRDSTRPPSVVGSTRAGHPRYRECRLYSIPRIPEHNDGFRRIRVPNNETAQSRLSHSKLIISHQSSHFFQQVPTLPHINRAPARRRSPPDRASASPRCGPGRGHRGAGRARRCAPRRCRRSWRCPPAGSGGRC